MMVTDAIDGIEGRLKEVKVGSSTTTPPPPRRQVTEKDVAEREAWVAEYVSKVDAMDARSAWVHFATKDVRLRFGNISDIYGLENVVAFFETQYESVIEMSHQQGGRIDVLSDRTYYTGFVDFKISGDDTEDDVISIYVVQIFEISPGEDKMKSCELVLDPSPLIERIAQIQEEHEGYEHEHEL